MILSITYFAYLYAIPCVFQVKSRFNVKNVGDALLGQPTSKFIFLSTVMTNLTNVASVRKCSQDLARSRNTFVLTRVCHLLSYTTKNAQVAASLLTSSNRPVINKAMSAGYVRVTLTACRPVCCKLSTSLLQVCCYPQNLLFASRLAASCITAIHQRLNTRQLSSTLINSYQNSPTLINTHQLLTTLINSYQHSSTLINTHQLLSTLINSYQHSPTLINTHQLVSTLTNSYQHSSTLINTHQLLSTLTNSYQLLLTVVNSCHHSSTLITCYHHSSSLINTQQLSSPLFISRD